MLDIIFQLILLPIVFYYIYFLLSVLKGLFNLEKCKKNIFTKDFVTVIIPFRNESNIILESLKSIEAQDYPIDNFEVIYVDDSSTDDSLEKIKANISKKNIKVFSVPNDFKLKAHKKRAIQFGIQNSKGEIIVTTDADCFHNKKWLSTLISGFDSETALISGPVEFKDEKGFFNKLQKLEFASLIITGAGLIGANKPMICNGANLAYRKSVFKKVGGFEGQMGLSSGDDEILMQRIWKRTKYKIKFCACRDAIAKTLPNKTFNQFYNQRKRWASKSIFYELGSTVFSIIMIFFFYLSLFLLIVLSIINTSTYLPILFLVFFLKILFEIIVLIKGVKLLFDKKILRYFLLAEFFHIPYILISVIAGIFGNFEWKERRLRR